MQKYHLIKYYSNTGLRVENQKLKAIADVAIAPWKTHFPDAYVLSIAEFSFGRCTEYESVEAWRNNPPAPDHGWRICCAWDSSDRERIMVGESLSSAVEERDGHLILVQTEDRGAITSQSVWQDIHDWSPAWRKPSVKARAQKYGVKLAQYRKV